MARIEFSIAFTLSTIASFLIFFAYSVEGGCREGSNVLKRGAR